MVSGGGCDGDVVGSEIDNDGSNAVEESGILKPMVGLLSTTKGWERVERCPSATWWTRLYSPLEVRGIGDVS